MFSEITSPSQELFDLRIAIANGCCIIDPSDNLLVILLAKTKKIWEDSGFGRKLTLEECTYVADGIRQAYNIPFDQQTWYGNAVYEIIGGEDTNKTSILSIINIGLIGVFAFIGYKIISRKK